MGLEDFVNDIEEKELNHSFDKVNVYEVVGIIAKWALLSDLIEIKITKSEE
jgi:hypothetical protein